MERVHVEGQTVEPSSTPGLGAIHEAVEPGESVYEFPDPVIVGVEYVWTVSMYVDIIMAFGVSIATDVISLFDH